MPRYQVTLDGKTFVVEGDRPPSEDEARQAFAAYQPPKAEPAKPEERSVSGFLGNVASSGGKFIKDTITGIPEAAKLIGKGASMVANPSAHTADFNALGENAPRMVSAAGSALKNRYGGMEQIKNTLYTDPVGVASDISTVMMPAKAGLQAGGFSKLAKIAGTVGEATNPMRAMQPVAKAVEYGTAGAIRPMLKPSKALKLQQSGPLEIERTALKTGAVTEGSAGAKMGAAVERANQAASGASGTIQKGRIVSLPKSLEKVERGLSHGDDLDTLARVEAEAADSLPDAIGARDLLDKRRHLDRELNAAYRSAERGGPPVGMKQSGQKEMLGNVRGALRDVAPGIRAADDEARTLGMVRSAISDAGLRAGDIPMGAALLGGGLMAGGIPGAGAIGSLFGLGRTFPQIPLALGSVPVRATAAAAKPLSRQAALIAALAGRDE